jgi:hypothetical protein
MADTSSQQSTPRATPPVAPVSKRARVRKEWRIVKLARVAVYVGCVSSLATGLVIRSAYGDVKETALALGSELAKIDPNRGSGPLVLNGQNIYVASTVESVSVEQVLDSVEAHCEHNGDGIRAELQDMSASLKKPAPKRGRAARGIMREEAEGRGMVACFAEGRFDPDSDSLERFELFAETGDLSAFGNLRYVYATETPSGRTHIVSAWTDGRFELGSMFPSTGEDAPGSDPVRTPRPPGSRRILSATLDDAPYSVRVYEAQSTAADVLRPYDASMTESGYSVLVSEEGTNHRVYSRAGVDLFVTATEDGDQAVISLIEIDGRGSL